MNHSLSGNPGQQPEPLYQVFRREPINAPAVGWAIACDVANGFLTIRTGTPGKLDQTQRIPTKQPDRDRIKAILQQEALGFRYIGQFAIHPGGCPYLQEKSETLLQDESALSWEITSPQGAAKHSGLIRRAFYDSGRILERLQLAHIEEHLIQIGSWTLGISARPMQGINSLCHVTGEGAGMISSGQILPVVFLQSLVKRLPDSFHLVIATSDGLEVPFDLKPGSTLLDWSVNGTNQISPPVATEKLRPAAEALGLLEVKIDLNSILTASNYYF